MSLRTVRTAAGRAFALVAAALAVVVLALTVVVPRLGGGTPYTILTGSMRPQLPPGSVVVVRPTPADEIKVGDVVTYQLESGEPTVATHRVVSVGVTLDGEYRFVTQGDANDSADVAPVRPEQIRGVSWYTMPYVGLPAMMVGAGLRQVVVMGTVVLLFGYAAASFAGAYRDRRRAARRTCAGVTA